tara:strand:- start:1690 stop:1935 length:246 start_codon:yes stop_codon:yes gene_type:complete
MSYNDTEIYILQTLCGIIPKDLWNHNKDLAKDPFDGYSEKDKRIAKRKFRKLKRKAGVKHGDSVRVAWSKINWMLNNKYKE